MNGLHFLFIGIALSMMILVSGCNTPYITKDGERLLSNSVVGCAVGQVFFDDCKAGAELKDHFSFAQLYPDFRLRQMLSKFADVG